MTENNREVEQATAALVAELMKLSPLEGEARNTLCLTIENAMARFALAIQAHVRNTPEACPVEPTPVAA